jgi:protein-S-isoprenylcysteine O-methyltransferase Ste14
LANLRGKLSTFFKGLVAFLIFGATQLTPIVGFYGFMIAPLMIYLPFTSVGRQFFLSDLAVIFLFNQVNFFGALIFYLGLIVFCVSFVEWVKFHREGLGLFNRGLYSMVRHPQFLGIIIMTLGLTIKTLTTVEGWELIGVPFNVGVQRIGAFELAGLWFLQVLGYIAFAAVEERSLSKKYAEFRAYKERVPLLLPIKSPKRVPEVLFTVLLVVGVCVVVYLLPYGLIRAFSYNLFTYFSNH